MAGSLEALRSGCKAACPRRCLRQEGCQNAEAVGLAPIELTGRKITTTFWGQAWCDNLKRYSDFANRLPRGRTYVRNGSVLDLQIQRGKAEALVSGSEIYRVTIDIHTLAKSVWKQIKRDCSQSIASLIDLLQGRFDQGIMQRLTQVEGGLFPQPGPNRDALHLPGLGDALQTRGRDPVWRGGKTRRRP